MTVRVFLVEDMQQVQGVVADLLDTLGDFTLAGAVRTEAEAKLWLQDHPGRWDLAVIDLVLEQGTGLGVIADARAGADPKGGWVVVFSDYASDGIRNHCLRLGADAVFGKGEGLLDFMGYCSGLARAEAAA